MSIRCKLGIHCDHEYECKEVKVRFFHNKVIMGEGKKERIKKQCCRCLRKRKYYCGIYGHDNPAYRMEPYDIEEIK